MGSSSGKHVYLLLGAGFSRNWGGWLAAEVEEYLLWLSTLNSIVRQELLNCHADGGFEKALANLSKSDQTIKEFESLQDALGKMFHSMNKSFTTSHFRFEETQDIKHLVSRFLCRFDAIFTLNQDLLLEHNYFPQVVTMSRDVGRIWNGCIRPGLTPVVGSSHDPIAGTWKPDNWDGGIPSYFQPYIKLHGSSNWVTSDNGRMLIMGENKTKQISGQSILQQYNQFFRSCLSQPNARLMTIGFGFGDEHIYDAILEAVSKNGLKVFIVDPLGLDVLDKNRNMRVGNGVYTRDKNFEAIWPSVIGASRRNLPHALATDPIEREKYEMFFA
jgi:hypothetical protein